MSGKIRLKEKLEGGRFRGVVVIYKASCSDMAPGHMNGTPNDTHSCRFASQAC